MYVYAPNYLILLSGHFEAQQGKCRNTVKEDKSPSNHRGGQVQSSYRSEEKQHQDLSSGMVETTSGEKNFVHSSYLCPKLLVNFIIPTFLWFIT